MGRKPISSAIAPWRFIKGIIRSGHPQLSQKAGQEAAKEGTFVLRIGRTCVQCPTSQETD